MEEILKEAVDSLRRAGVSVSKIESDLGISNGRIGKALARKVKLPDDIIDEIVLYAANFSSGESGSIAEDAAIEPEFTQNEEKAVNVSGRREWTLFAGANADNQAFGESLSVFHDAIEAGDRAAVQSILNYPHTQLNIRQHDGVVARCKNWLSGNWGKRN